MLRRFACLCLMLPMLWATQGRANVEEQAAEYLAPYLAALQGANEVNAAAIRLRLSTEPAIVSGVVWAEDGSRVFPPEGLLHVSETDLLSQVDTLHALMERSEDGAWVPFGIDPSRLSYCESGARVCLLVDGAALADGLGLPDAEAIRSALLNPSNGGSNPLWWGFGAFALLATFLWVRGRAQRQKQKEVKQVDPGSFVLMDVRVHPRRLCAERQGQEIALTARDVKILEYLSQHAGEVISKDTLYDVGWGRDFMPNSRALDQHIATLRRKLDPEKSSLQVIETVHGQGYRVPA